MATEQQASYNAILGVAGIWPRIRGGQRLTISSRIVSKLAFVLSKYGSPSADVTFEIRKVSDNSLIMSKVWGSAADLQASGSEQLEEVEFNTPTFINEEVRICVLYSADISNFRVELHYQNTDVKASELLAYQNTEGGAWTDIVEYDAAYRYTYNSIVAPTVTTDPATEIT